MTAAAPVSRRHAARAAVLGLLILAALLPARPLDAQLRGAPVLSPGRPNPTAPLVLHGLAARAAEDAYGTGWAGALVGSHLVGRRVTVAAGAGRAPVADAGRPWQAMAGAALTVLRTDPAPVMPALAVAAGAGKVFSSRHDERVATLSLPLDVVLDRDGLFIEPFVAPRVHTRRLDRGAGAFSQSGPGVSYGVRVGLAVGSALLLAADHARYGAATGYEGAAARPETVTTLALGLRVSVRRQ